MGLQMSSFSMNKQKEYNLSNTMDEYFKFASFILYQC